MSLRDELRKFKVVRDVAQRVRSVSGQLAQNAVFAQYLQGDGFKGLNVGSSQRFLAGWLNTDIAPAKGVNFLDATRPIPAPAESFDYLFGEHFIEHITHEQGRLFLLEAFRVLKPGGVIRLATPSLEKAASLYASPYSEEKKNYVAQYLSIWHPHVKEDGRAFIFDSLFRKYGHQFIYDRPTLQHLLVTTGFTEVVFAEVGKSTHRELNHLEFRADGPIADLNHFETMVIEGTRPGGSASRPKAS